MYSVTVSEPFIAQHILTVPDAPPEESTLHSHAFEAEVTFRGRELGEHGYLLDIDLAGDALAGVVDAYRDETLNDHLEGNPSAERLARRLFDDLAGTVDAPAVETLTVAVHEDDTAVVSVAGPLE